MRGNGEGESFQLPASPKKNWRLDAGARTASSCASCASGTARGWCQPAWRRLISDLASCGSSKCNFVLNAVPNRYSP